MTRSSSAELPSRFGRGALALLAVCVLLAGVPRLESALHRTTFVDEAFAMALVAGRMPLPFPSDAPAPAQALRSLLDGVASPLAIADVAYREDVHAPGHALLSAAARFLAGDGLLPLRLLSLLLSLGTLALAGLLAHRLATESWWIAPVLLVLAPAAVWQGYIVRGYALAALLLTAACWCAVRSLQAERPLRWATVAGLLIGLGPWAHYFTVFVGGWLLCGLLIGHVRRPRVLVATVAAAAVPGLAVVPFLLRHLGARPGQWNGFPGWSQEGPEVLRALLFGLVPLYRGLWPGRIQQVLWLALLMAMAATLVLAARAFLRTRDGRYLGRVLALGAPFVHAGGVLLLAALTNKTFTQTLGEASRYLSLAVPLLAVAVALVMPMPAAAALRGWRLPRWAAVVPVAFLVGAQLEDLPWGAVRSRGTRVFNSHSFRERAQAIGAYPGSLAIMFDQRLNHQHATLLLEASPRQDVWLATPSTSPERFRQALAGRPAAALLVGDVPHDAPYLAQTRALLASLGFRQTQALSLDSVWVRPTRSAALPRDPAARP